ncbi:MAG: DUF4013 domain-containing protein [Parvularculaceae bacterium]
MVGALFRPFFDPRRLLIGAIVSYIPILALMATGYAARLARAARDGTGAPSWNRWLFLFVDGLMIATVTAIYAAPYAIAASASETAAAPPVVRQLFLLLMLLATPAALARMAVRRNFFSAFAVPKVIRHVLSVRYLAAWVLWAAIMLAAIAGVGSLPDWGVYLVPGIAFILLAISASLFGWTVREP